MGHEPSPFELLELLPPGLWIPGAIVALLVFFSLPAAAIGKIRKIRPQFHVRLTPAEIGPEFGQAMFTGLHFLTGGSDRRIPFISQANNAFWVQALNGREGYGRLDHGRRCGCSATRRGVGRRGE